MSIVNGLVNEHWESALLSSRLFLLLMIVKLDMLNDFSEVEDKVLDDIDEEACLEENVLDVEVSDVDDNFWDIEENVFVDVDDEECWEGFSSTLAFPSLAYFVFFCFEFL